jgi:hypothetical protein
MTGNKTLQALETQLGLTIACDISQKRIAQIPPICHRVVLDATQRAHALGEHGAGVEQHGRSVMEQRLLRKRSPKAVDRHTTLGRVVEIVVRNRRKLVRR